MNSTPTAANSATGRSLMVAQSIAAMCPDALFCTFGVTERLGKVQKVPFNKMGAGVSSDTPPEHLYTSAELLKNPAITRGTYWGVVMHQPIYDPFGSAVLTIVDVDTKSSNAPRDMRLTKLSQWAKENGAMRELSHSRKGIHIICLAMVDERTQGKYDLGNGQAVEVFGQPHSPKKSVMLTGDELTRPDLNPAMFNVHNIFKEMNIAQIPQVAQIPQITQELLQNFEKESLEILRNSQDALQQPQTQWQPPSPYGPQLDDHSRSIDAIRYLDPDMTHDEWVMVGMALKDGLGDQGLQVWIQWSQQGSKFLSVAECNTKWKSFKKSGVKINTLFGMAQRAGWQNPRKGLRKGVAGPSARDDFAQYIGDQSIGNTGHGGDQSIDPNTGEITNPPKGWPEIDYSLLKLPPIDYLIEGFFAYSFSVFAGQPGVGKTTAVVSLALIVAGFNIPNSDCATKSRRKIIYVSEDSAQIVRSLYGYCKIFGFDPVEIAQWFVLIDSHRSDVDEVLRLAHNVDIHTIRESGGSVERPWLIIDTANATLDIENENDNSEVGKYIAALKELIYTKMHTPLSIITHTSKTVGRADDGALARGASAFTGDATLTGAIFLDEDERYFRLTKHRYEPEFKEVRFETQFYEAVVLDRHGDMQSQRCIVVTPVSSSQGAREAIRDEAREVEQEGRQRDVLDRVTQYVRALINKTPQGVCMRKGRLPKSPPVDMAAMHKLTVDEIQAAVTGASSNDVRSRLVWKVVHEFAFEHENSENLWVQLK